MPSHQLLQYHKLPLSIISSNLTTTSNNSSQQIEVHSTLPTQQITVRIFFNITIVYLFYQENNMHKWKYVDKRRLNTQNPSG